MLAAVSGPMVSWAMLWQAVAFVGQVCLGCGPNTEPWSHKGAAQQRLELWKANPWLHRMAAGPDLQGWPVRQASTSTQSGAICEHFHVGRACITASCICFWQVRFKQSDDMKRVHSAPD